MNKLKRLIVALLIAAMLVSVLSITGFADNSDVDISRFSEGTGYLAFGDSITRGYGANHDLWDSEGYKLDSTEDPNARNVTGAYPKIVADAIGCYTPDNILDSKATYWPIAQDAVSTAFICDLLGIEDNYCDSDYLYAYSSVRARYETDLYYFGYENSVGDYGVGTYGQTGVAMPVNKLVEESSLISIAVGMGDVLNRARSLGTDEFLANGDFSDIAGAATAVANTVKYMYEGYEYFKEAFPLILDYFKANAREDAVIVIVGAMNPIYNMTITDDTLLPIGNALSIITDLMNKCYKQWAEEYGYIFVDISNVETGTTEGEMSFVTFLGQSTRDQGFLTHPTATGYRQIANSILYELREHEAETKSSETDIKIDLGRIKDVSSVTVNGKKIENYTINDGILTVPYGASSAKSLSVAYVGDDGKVTASVYTLSNDNGYSEHRAYTSNDAGKVVRTVVDCSKGVISGIKGLFK